MPAASARSASRRTTSSASASASDSSRASSGSDSMSPSLKTSPATSAASSGSAGPSSSKKGAAAAAKAEAVKKEQKSDAEDDEDEEEWDPSLPKPRPGEVGVTKRTLQNRKAQREFRKRREARVRDLEARCRRFDQLGIEANTELQRVARRMKEENDVLRGLLTRLGFAHMIQTALDGALGASTAADALDPNVLAATPGALPYVLGGEKQAPGKVGGRASQQLQKKEQAEAASARQARDAESADAEAARRRSGSLSINAGAAAASASNAPSSMPTSAASATFALPPAVPGQNIDPNMLHQPSSTTVVGFGAGATNANQAALHMSIQPQHAHQHAGRGAADQPGRSGSGSGGGHARTSSSPAGMGMGMGGGAAGGDSNQLLALSFGGMGGAGAGGRGAALVGAADSDDMTMRIMNAVHARAPGQHATAAPPHHQQQQHAQAQLPPRGNPNGAGLSGSAMLHSDESYLGTKLSLPDSASQQQDRQQKQQQQGASTSSGGSYPSINMASSSALGLDSSAGARAWSALGGKASPRPNFGQQMGGSGSGMGGGGSSSSGGGANLFPMAHATHTSDALLNPNPIPFAFDLSNTGTPPGPATDLNSWWQQMQMGGAVLPSRTNPDGDDILDEKAAMFAEAQRQKQIQLQGHSNAAGGGAGGNAGHGASGSGTGTGTGSASILQNSEGQSPIDLTMFLNGGFTPGGGFNFGGQAIGAGDPAVTPGIAGAAGGDADVLWAQGSGSASAAAASPMRRTPSAQQAGPSNSSSSQPQQQQQQQQGADPQNPSLPQTEHAQMFLKLLERKLAMNSNQRDFEELGFRPPSIARDDAAGPSGSGNGGGSSSAYSLPAPSSASHASLKRKLANDDSALMPAPEQRASRKVRTSHSTGQLIETEHQERLVAGSDLTAGGIYSRLSQHPAFLSTNLYELEELVDAMGDRQPPNGQQLQQQQKQAQQLPHHQQQQQQQQRRDSPHGVHASLSPHGSYGASGMASAPSLARTSSSGSRGLHDDAAGAGASARSRSNSSDSGRGGGGAGGAGGGASAPGGAGASSNKTGLDRVFGLLDRKYASSDRAPSPGAYAKRRVTDNANGKSPELEMRAGHLQRAGP